MPHRALVACAVATCLGVLAVPLAPATASPPPTYVPPVDAPVVDPFRAPTTPYGPGNRGLEYGTEPGTEVVAAADGVVTFAGLVAGTRHVTVLHDDGVRTSYSFLARIDVVVGQHLRQGDVVGITAGTLHFGARVGDAYFDPASLFGTGPPQVHLVPFDLPPGDGLGGERRALAQLVGGIGSLAADVAGRALDGAAATAEWLRQDGLQLVRTAAHYMELFAPGWAQLHYAMVATRAWERARAAADRPCTASDAPAPAPPPERRVALLVAGLGSTSTNGAIDDIDTSALGYEGPDVVRFSYAGGRTPDPGDGFAGVPSSPYGPADSQIDLRLAAGRLADLVGALVAEAPGVPLDLYAHSQGGLVVRLALIELQRRHGDAWLAHVGLVATLGTPHEGADLATGAYAIGSTRAGSAAFDAAAGALHIPLDDDAASVQQLAETSDVVRELADTPLPDDLRAVSIAARGDAVVPVPRTQVDGALQVVVPVDGISAHDALPGSPEAGRELALALAGLPPTCQRFRDALLGQLTGEGISLAEDSAAAVGWLANLGMGPPIGG
jgi:hypothetical protein